jgi:hypothetical protein
MSNEIHANITGNKAETVQRKQLMSYFPPFINKIYADIKLKVDRIRNYERIKREFYHKVGYRLNLESPRSFNEKIIWKKLYDRNPLLTLTADKFGVISYVKETLGYDLANKILKTVYYVTSKPETIPFDRMPDNFVVKPNHGSGMHLIIRGYKNDQRDYIIKKCREWLKTNHGLYNQEWAYRNIKRKIIVEELLSLPDGRLPLDYKLYCFHGECKLIRVALNRFTKDEYCAYYDTNWNYIPASSPGYKTAAEPFDKPDNLIKIIDIAERLSAKLDAVRVDLYTFNKKIYFGELTHYDALGLARYEPESFDFELGSCWTIKKDYWKKN